MPYTLSFALSRAANYHTCTFPTIKAKQDYVKAETRDLTCQEAYYAYQVARLEKRQTAAEKVDSVRFSFCNRWYKENIGKLKVLPNPNNDDGGGMIA